jgi:DNA polymerase-1
VRVAVARDPSGTALLCELAADGRRAAEIVAAGDFATAVADFERSAADEVRWVWSSAADHYPGLLQAGVRVGRCHDVTLTERLLLARDGRGGEPASLSAAWARLRGVPVPEEPGEPGGYGASGLYPHAAQQGALFETAPRRAGDAGAGLDALIAVHADQLRRIAADEHAAKFAALVAAESAGGLVAAEMAFAGLPWRADVHDELLVGLLGPPRQSLPAAGQRGWPNWPGRYPRRSAAGL